MEYNKMEAAAIITTIASIIKTVVDLTPTVIKGIEDARPFAEAIFKTLKGDKEITQEELTELEARMTDLSNQLQLP